MHRKDFCVKSASERERQKHKKHAIFDANQMTFFSYQTVLFNQYSNRTFLLTTVTSTVIYTNSAQYSAVCHL